MLGRETIEKLSLRFNSDYRTLDIIVCCIGVCYTVEVEIAITLTSPAPVDIVEALVVDATYDEGVAIVSRRTRRIVDGAMCRQFIAHQAVPLLVSVLKAMHMANLGRVGKVLHQSLGDIGRAGTGQHGSILNPYRVTHIAH